MSGFAKRRSIDKKHKQQQQTEIPTLNTTKSSLRPSSSRVLSNNNKTFQQTVQKIQQLTSVLEELSSQVWEKEVSEITRKLLEFNRGILISQKLIGYKQAGYLLCKFGNCLKKEGKLFNEKNTALCLNVFKNVTQQLNLLTKEERNDELILEAHISPAIFQLLKIFVVSIQEQSKLGNEKKPSLMMRKNSLKKVSEGSISVRPSSRGKLTTLSKKDKTLTKTQILPELRDLKQKQSSQQNIQQNSSDLQFIVFNLCCTIKNLSANKKVRKDLLKLEYLQIMNRYLRIWSQQKALTNFGSNILIQITSSYRHLAAQDKSYSLLNDVNCNCFGTWITLVEKFPTSNDIVFNILRILSKFSSYQDFCEKLNGKKKCLKTLSNFFKMYKASIHIVIRISFIFANMTSYFSDIRNQLYFDFDSWPDIFTCFEHYANSELKGKSEVDKMGVSMAAWDYQAMRKQSDVQALIKIIRLIANIFTVQEIGQHIYRERANDYRSLIKKLKSLLQVKANIEKASQLAATVLSCLTNTLYYDREFLLANNDYKMVKKQLIDVLVDFVVQIDNEQVCCESLRVLSNLTRMKQFIKHILDAKLHQGVFILLDSTSKEIVYYSFGIIINLLVDDEFKSQYRTVLIESIISILNECKSEDFDIVTVALKALSIIIDNRSQNIDPNQLAQIQNCLTNLGSFCDNALMTESHKIQVESAQQSRNLINILINNMPQEKYACPIKNCGRKFADESKLQQHVNRRHKLA